MTERTVPNQATRDEEAREAAKGADAGRGPTAEESAAADGRPLSSDVAAHEREMAERGAKQKGEGQLP